MSASSSTTSGLLPPSSSTVRLSIRPAASPTSRPVAVEPVNEIMRTFGSSTSAWPTSPAPGQHVQHALGQAGLLEEPRDHDAAGDRGVGVRLQNDGVAERERAADRAHREHVGEVPGRDHADDADRHAPGGARPSGRQRRQLDLAERLRRSARGHLELADRGARSRGRPCGGIAPDSRMSQLDELGSVLLHQLGRALRRPRRARVIGVSAHSTLGAAADVAARAIVRASPPPAVPSTSPVAGSMVSICVGRVDPAVAEDLPRPLAARRADSPCRLRWPALS